MAAINCKSDRGLVSTAGRNSVFSLSLSLYDWVWKKRFKLHHTCGICYGTSWHFLFSEELRSLSHTLSEWIYLTAFPCHSVTKVIHIQVMHGHTTGIGWTRVKTERRPRSYCLLVQWSVWSQQLPFTILTKDQCKLPSPFALENLRENICTSQIIPFSSTLQPPIERVMVYEVITLS